MKYHNPLQILKQNESMLPLSLDLKQFFYPQLIHLQSREQFYVYIYIQDARDRSYPFRQSSSSLSIQISLCSPRNKSEIDFSWYYPEQRIRDVNRKSSFQTKRRVCPEAMVNWENLTLFIEGWTTLW